MLPSPDMLVSSFFWGEQLRDAFFTHFLLAPILGAVYLCGRWFHNRSMRQFLLRIPLASLATLWAFNLPPLLWLMATCRGEGCMAPYLGAWATAIYSIALLPIGLLIAWVWPIVRGAFEIAPFQRRCAFTVGAALVALTIAGMRVSFRW